MSHNVHFARQMDPNDRLNHEQASPDVDDDFNLASHFEDSSSDSNDDDLGVCWEHIDDQVLTLLQFSQNDPACSTHSPAQQLTALEGKMHFRGFLKHINITACPSYNPCLLTCHVPIIFSLSTDEPSDAIWRRILDLITAALSTLEKASFDGLSHNCLGFTDKF